MKHLACKLFAAVIFAAGSAIPQSFLPQHLAPTTRAAATRAAPETGLYPIPQEVRKMPAWHLLEALDLLSLKRSSGVKILEDVPFRYAGGYRVVRIQIAHKYSARPRGLDILYHEFDMATRFTLLYNEKGYLLAIFANPQSHKTPRRYMNLSAYYFEIPPVGHRGARERWEAFRDEWLRNQAYLLFFGCKLENQVNADQYPFVYAEFDREAGPFSGYLYQFTPAEVGFFDRSFSYDGPFRRNPAKHQFVFPVFPTVYSPARHMFEDLNYYRALYFGELDFAGKKNGRRRLSLPIGSSDRILLMGPGAGLELWFLSLRAPGARVAVRGLNPLEVANARATAELAGNLRSDAGEHDNLVSPEGTLAAAPPFDRILWNMPAYRHTRRRSGHYAHYWDGGFHSPELERFLDGLNRLLAEDGIAYFWNGANVEKEDLLFSRRGLKLAAFQDPFEPPNYAGGNRLFLVTRAAGAVEESI